MQLNINIKQMGKKGRRIKPVAFFYESTPQTAEELIEATVRKMLEAYRARQKATREECIPEPLSEAELSAMAEIGRVAFGYIYNEAEPDERKALTTAKEAYMDGLVRIFINGEEAEYNPAGTKLTLKDGDEISFVRLTMLAGRIW